MGCPPWSVSSQQSLPAAKVEEELRRFQEQEEAARSHMAAAAVGIPLVAVDNGMDAGWTGWGVRPRKLQETP